eukprot:719729-Prymnesium_polylepis.1
MRTTSVSAYRCSLPLSRCHSAAPPTRHEWRSGSFEPHPADVEQPITETRKDRSVAARCATVLQVLPLLRATIERRRSESPRSETAGGVAASDALSGGRNRGIPRTSSSVIVPCAAARALTSRARCGAVRADSPPNDELMMK